MTASGAITSGSVGNRLIRDRADAATAANAGGVGARASEGSRKILEPGYRYWA